jgi:hypothetical protein
MATLHVDLQDGFRGDPVVVRLSGREIYRNGALKTDLRISRADGLEAEAPDAGATIEVDVGGRTASANVDPARTPYLAVNVEADGRPAIKAATEPFAYL